MRKEFFSGRFRFKDVKSVLMEIFKARASTLMPFPVGSIAKNIEIQLKIEPFFRLYFSAKEMSEKFTQRFLGDQ